jgi:pyruvate dehydrogenase E1 component alpha subunit
MRDCLKKFRASVTEAGLLTHADIDAVDADIMETIENAVARAKAADRPTAEDVLADVYISY